MKEQSNCILNAIVIGVVLNLVLPVVLKPLATEEEKKPSNGASGGFEHECDGDESERTIPPVKMHHEV